MDNLVLTIFGGYATWAFTLTFILGFIIGGTATAFKWWLFPIPAFCIILGYGYFTYQIGIAGFTHDWTAGVASIAPLLWLIMSGLAVYKAASVNWDETHSRKEDSK